VFSLSEQYAVPAEGPDQFRCFVIPLNLDRDVYVRSVEFRPGNSRVVHHSVIFTDPTGASRKLAQGAGSYPCLGGPGFVDTGLIGGWTPGSIPFAPPAGMTSPIRKETNLVLQIHYHPSGKKELDQSSIGIRFGDAPTVAGDTLILSSWGIDIPPGESQYVVRSALTVPSDVEAMGIVPHAHYLAKEMNIKASAPDGSSIPLITIKDWDFNWQGTYIYQTPIKLTKGTRIEFEYTYDNSEKNPRNPSNPPKHVRFGEESTDEMAFAFVLVRLPSLEDGPAFQREVKLEVLNQFLVSGSIDNLPP
jgi:hypothetical protein